MIQSNNSFALAWTVESTVSESPVEDYKGSPKRRSRRFECRWIRLPAESKDSAGKLNGIACSRPSGGKKAERGKGKGKAKSGPSRKGQLASKVADNAADKEEGERNKEEGGKTGFSQTRRACILFCRAVARGGADARYSRVRIRPGKN